MVEGEPKEQFTTVPLLKAVLGTWGARESWGQCISVIDLSITLVFVFVFAQLISH